MFRTQWRLRVAAPSLPEREGVEPRPSVIVRKIYRSAQRALY